MFISLLRLYTFFSRSLLVNIFSLRMRVSSKELFSTLKNFLTFHWQRKERRTDGWIRLGGFIPLPPDQTKNTAQPCTRQSSVGFECLHIVFRVPSLDIGSSRSTSALTRHQKTSFTAAEHGIQPLMIQRTVQRCVWLSCFLEFCFWKEQKTNIWACTCGDSFFAFVFCVVYFLRDFFWMLAAIDFRFEKERK